MKEIKLSKTGKYKGQFVALVDDKNYVRLNQFNWQVTKVERTYYATRRPRENKIEKYITMQSMIIDCKEGMELDHWDRNGLNNQEYNIRECTHQQNNFNRRSKRKGKYKGVSCNKNENRANKYLAQIKYNNKPIYLGRFKTEEDAAIAYDKKAAELFGEFACLNFE